MVATLATIRYSIINVGTPAFPIYTVWQDPEDEHGYTIEHECTELARFPTLIQATEFLTSYKNKGEFQCQLVIN